MKFSTFLCTCYGIIRNIDLHRYIHLEILENKSPLSRPGTFWIQYKLYTLPKRKISGQEDFNDEILNIYLYLLQDNKKY